MTRKHKWLHLKRLMKTTLDTVVVWWRGRRLDCSQCGACCKYFEDDGVPVFNDELERVPAEFITRDTQGFNVMRSKDGACIAWSGEGSSSSCAIYKCRPRSCSEFRPGSADCLQCRQFFKITW